MAILKLKEGLADILCKIYSDYKSYTTRDKRGVKQLLLHCQNALQGTMVASLLYYCKSTKTLTSIWFDTNPYDPCVTNNLICGSQIMICFHIDGCKLIHCIHKANQFMIEWIFKEYDIVFQGGSGKMSVIRGKVREYLRITLNYTVCGQMSITMFSFVEQILTDFDKTDTKREGHKVKRRSQQYFW